MSEDPVSNTLSTNLLHRNQKETKQINILCESICPGHFGVLGNEDGGL